MLLTVTDGIQRAGCWVAQVPLHFNVYSHCIVGVALAITRTLAM
jgi:hypothetical protein